MAGPVWTDFGQFELDEILFYIGVTRRRPETAERLYYEIRDAVETHHRKSKPGHLHPSLPEGWRYFKFKRWLIVHEPVAEGMIVHRIVDAARDWPKQFERGL